MQQSEFKELVKKAFEQRFQLFDKKAHDYATQDCLSNFKRISQLLQLLNVNTQTTEGTCLFYILMKFDRVCNLLGKGEPPKNESISDTLNDLQNYIDLLRGVLYEKASQTSDSSG